MAKSVRNKKKPIRRRDDRTQTAAQRGYTYAWRKARQQWLLALPVCVECQRIDVPSKMVVDHIQPHRGCQQLFWDRNNWQTLCKLCHDDKTGRGE
jgi:5-methylcytosine-specific restriction enzyme A